MNVRLLKAEDVSQAKALAGYSFVEKSFADWFFDSYVKPEQLIGNFDAEERLKCMLCIATYELILLGKTASSAYITTVTTAPEARGKGYFRPLLRYTFEHLRQAGKPVAILKAIESKLYSPFGFAFCYNHLRYSMPIKELVYFEKNSDLNLTYISELPNAIPILGTIYDSVVCMHYNGASMRTNQNWLDLLTVHVAEGGHVLLAQDEAAGLMGYMLYYVRNNTFEIFEMITNSQIVQSHFLNIAYQHRTQAKDFFWRTFADNTAYLDMNISQYADSFYPQLAPFMMARIVDVKMLLNGFATTKCPEIGKFCLQITDDLLEFNNCVLELGVSHNRVQAEYTNKVPDMQMDIATLAQLVFGARSAKELHKEGKLIINRNTILCMCNLEAIFSQTINYINEEF